MYHLERGQRAAPSARALELRGAERQAFYDAVFELTGEAPDCEDEPDELLDLVSTLFSGVRDRHIISYAPGDARTLLAYRQEGWQIRR